LARPPGIPINHHALSDFVTVQNRTFSEVAVGADVSTSRMSELVKGTGRPSGPTLRKLAETLRVSSLSLRRWFEGADVGVLITEESLLDRCDLDQLERLHRMATAALNRKHREHLRATGKAS
jgi:transcriptional regulator with XRE-family HTH domain